VTAIQRAPLKDEISPALVGNLARELSTAGRNFRGDDSPGGLMLL